MFILAVLGFLILTFITTATAIFTVPSPDYFHAPKNHNIGDVSDKVTRNISSNEVMQNTNDDNSSINETEIIDDRSNNDGQTMYVIEFESDISDKNLGHGEKEKNSDIDEIDNQSPLDPWSIVWYIGSFGGLVTFFLIVSCSEWCCRKNAGPIGGSCDQRCSDNNGQNNNTTINETPPPPYEAPPPYESLNYGDLIDKASGEKLDIYVITLPISSTAQSASA